MFTKHSQRFLLFLFAFLGLILPWTAQAQTVSVTSLANPSNVGAPPITFQATVIVGGLLGSAGNVQFYADGTPFGGLQPIAIASPSVLGDKATTGLVPFTFTTAGPHTVTAIYTQTAPSATTTSGSVTQFVKAITTINPFTALPASPSQFGQTLTFSATVATSFGTPTGTVQFFQATNVPLGPPVSFDATGKATYLTSSLPASATAYSITAQYNGDFFNTTSTGTLTGGYKVDQAMTQVSVPSALPASPTFGQAVTLTSTVTTAGTVKPTGTITFKEGATVIGTASVNSNGTASYTTSSFSAASHTITAVYNGDSADGNFSGSTSAANLSLTVGAEPTTTTVTSSMNPSALGQSVTFTISVTGTSGVLPTGSVTLTYPNSSGTNTTTSGVSLNGNGQAQIPVANIHVGINQTVTANYTASGSFAASNGTTQQTVTATANPVSLTSSQNPSAFNAPVTFTVTVAGAGGGNPAPTGMVTFKNGTGTLGTAMLGAGGSATFPTSSLPVGINPITVHYDGDGNYNAADSGTLTQIINGAASVTNLSRDGASSNPSFFGQAVTFNVTVTPAAGTTPIPTGTVQFRDGVAVLGTVSVNAATGTASFTTSALAVTTVATGPHQISAVYSGDGTYNSSTSTASVSQSVNQAATLVNVATSQASSTFGQPVTFTANVMDNTLGSTGTPTGNVQFQIDAVNVGPPVALDNGGLASYTTSALTVNGSPHSIKAIYAGDSNFGGSNGTLSGGQTITAAATTTTVTTSLPSPVFGQAVIFTAAVTNATTGTATPTGTVQFQADGTNIGDPVTLSGGTASLTVPDAAAATPIGPLSVTTGPHQIVAFFTPDPASPNFSASDNTAAPLAQAVAQATTTTALASDKNPSTFSQQVTFTATISVTSPGHGTPGGTVEFFDGPTDLGPGAVSAGTSVDTAVATLQTNALAAGTHSVTAVYQGDASFSTSTAPALTQTVGQAGPAVAVTSNTNPSVYGQALNFSATVTGVPNNPPAGSVTFTDTNGAALGTGTLTQDLVSGISTTSITPTVLLAVGMHTITATYNPAAGSNFSSSSNTLTGGQTVNVANTTTTVGSSSGDFNPSTAQASSQIGESVTFTAKVGAVAPGSGAPTGTVQFKDTFTSITGQTNTSTNLGSPVTLDQTGAATFSTSNLAAGQHSITATYSGDVNFATSSNALKPLVQSVNPASNQVIVTHTPAAPTLGQPVTFTGTVKGQSGLIPTGTVVFQVDNVFVNPDGTPSADQTNGTPITLGSGQTSTTGSSALATFTTSSLSVGNHTIIATYSGDANYQVRANQETMTVSKVAATVRVTSSKNPSTFGDLLTFTANLSGVMGLTPQGTVQFLIDGNKVGADGVSGGDPATINASGVAVFQKQDLSVTFSLDGTNAPHTITAYYSGDGNYLSSDSSKTDPNDPLTPATLPGGQSVFNRQATIGTGGITPDHLLVPGTIRPSINTVLKTSDPQTLTITGTGFVAGATVLFANQTPGAVLPINGQRLTPDTISPDGTRLTVTITPALAAAAGLLSIEVDNPNTQPGQSAPVSFSNYPINPVQTVPTFPLGSSTFIRMFSLPYDYAGFSPYDILQGIALNGDLTKSYDPDLDFLAGVSLFPDATLLPIYHWDPTLVDYRATVALHGRTPDSLQLSLGQAYWVVGKTPDAATLGVMRIGASAAFNPTGIPLQAGWNMVGDPFPNDVPLANLAVLVQGASLPFYGPNSGVSNGIVSPVFWSYDGSQYQINYSGLAGHDHLQAYEGYWLYAYQPCTLSVTK